MMREFFKNEHMTILKKTNSNRQKLKETTHFSINKTRRTIEQ